MNTPTRTKLRAHLVRAAVGSATMVSAKEQMPTTSGRQETIRDIYAVESVSPSVTVEALAGESRFVITPPRTVEGFGKKNEKRFRDLAAKRALGTATEEEEQEFRDLQRDRRSVVQERSSESILAEYRRRQMLLETVNFLSRHVRFLRPEDQARLRSISKA